jgi:hypothetical protein
MKIDKLIVTCKVALRRKYGKASRTVDAAIRRLIAADKARGIVSLRIDLDVLTPALATTAAATTVQRLTKEAIDTASHRYTPDYVLIVGAPDVVVMQELANPMNADSDPDNDDDDVTVPSDLPYACEEPYSTNAATFLGPVRVVGRLPDMMGETRPAFLNHLLDLASGAKTRSRDEYRSYFALSAFVWRKSTELSVDNLFNDVRKMKVSPPSGPAWSQTALAPRVHFINCHGDDRTPKYFGQKREKYPTSHYSPKLPGKITEGTVVAAECCYGAQLYDQRKPQYPRDTNVPGIAVTYLDQGAYGFFGSTTIAYGPSEGNGQADLICQYFVSAVRDGASLGRAALEARHRFAGQLSHLDPSDLKTLAQFYLLGDPSIQPVDAPKHALSRTSAFRRAFHGRSVSTGARGFRRERASRTGTNLARSLGAVQPSRSVPPVAVRRVLTALASESGLQTWTIAAYRVMRGARHREEMIPRRRIFVLSGAVGGTFADGGRLVSIIATTERGKIVHLRRVHSR